MQHGPAIDTLRLPAATVRLLINALDQQQPARPNRGPSSRSRHPYTRQVMLTLYPSNAGRDAASEARRFLAHGRSINPRGAAILHGAFVHAETPCELQLVTADGERTLVRGRVVDCRHLTKRVHELSVEFDTPVDVTAYIHQHSTAPQAQPPTPPAASHAPRRTTTADPAAATIARPATSGPPRALLLAPTPGTTQPIADKLRAAGIHADTAAATDDALRWAAAAAYSLVVIAPLESPAAAAEFVAALRAQGCTAAVLIGSDDIAASLGSSPRPGVCTVKDLQAAVSIFATCWSAAQGVAQA